MAGAGAAEVEVVADVVEVEVGGSVVEVAAAAALAARRAADLACAAVGLGWVYLVLILVWEGGLAGWEWQGRAREGSKGSRAYSAGASLEEELGLLKVGLGVCEEDHDGGSRWGGVRVGGMGLNWAG